MASGESSTQKWLLQIRRGELRLINDLSELIRLILERRIDRKALLYKISDEPRSIGDLPEFAELFDGPLTPPIKLAGSDTVGALDGEQSFGTEDEVPYLDTISPLGSTEDAFGDYFDTVPRRRWPGALLAVAGLALVAGGGYLALHRSQSTAVSSLAAHVPPAPVPAMVPPPVLPAPAPAPPPVAAAPVAPPAPVAAAAVPPPAPLVAEAPVAAVAAPEPKPAPREESPPPSAAPAAAPAKVVHAGRVARVAKLTPPVAHPAPERVESPRNYEGLVRDGDRLIEAGKTKRAMALFEEAVKLRPDGVAALTGMGYGWLDRGDARRAAELFQRAMMKDGHFAPALFGLGEAYRDLGRRGEAVTAFRLYVSRFPGSREASAARRQVELLGGTASR